MYLFTFRKDMLSFPACSYRIFPTHSMRVRNRANPIRDASDVVVGITTADAIAEVRRRSNRRKPPGVTGRFTEHTLFFIVAPVQHSYFLCVLISYCPIFSNLLIDIFLFRSYQHIAYIFAHLPE